jgi:DNA-directed RNA polymerase specialized sigma24 family protein
MVNLSLNRLRKVRREWLTPSADPGVVVADASGDWSMEPWLESALQSLPARQRAAVALHYLDDLPVAEIANLMHCSTNTVKTHVRRGVAALRTSSALLDHREMTT